MSLMRRLFGRKNARSRSTLASDRAFHEGVDSTWAEREDLRESLGQMRRGEVVVRVPKPDMRSEPVDNPLDYREDGSIRPGDPAWDFMMEVMEKGSGSAVQRPDGTWETKTIGDQDDN